MVLWGLESRKNISAAPRKIRFVNLYTCINMVLLKNTFTPFIHVEIYYNGRKEKFKR